MQPLGSTGKQLKLDCKALHFSRFSRFFTEGKLFPHSAFQPQQLLWSQQCCHKKSVVRKSGRGKRTGKEQKFRSCDKVSFRRKIKRKRDKPGAGLWKALTGSGLPLIQAAIQFSPKPAATLMLGLAGLGLKPCCLFWSRESQIPDTQCDLGPLPLFPHGGGFSSILQLHHP